MNPLSSINDYIWHLLEQEQGWTLINGKVPILPTREQPEFDGQRQPYLVYSASRETGRGDLSPVRLGSVQYLIYAATLDATETTPLISGTRQVDNAIETLDNALNRLDESALDINRNAYHQSNPRRTALAGTHVNWTRVTNTQTADPGDAEGGKARGFIAIRFEYTVSEKAYPVLY